MYAFFHEHMKRLEDISAQFTVSKKEKGIWYSKLELRDDGPSLFILEITNNDTDMNKLPQIVLSFHETLSTLVPRSSTMLHSVPALRGKLQTPRTLVSSPFS